MVYLALFPCETSRLALQIAKRELSSGPYIKPLIDIISSTKYSGTFGSARVYTNYTLEYILEPNQKILIIIERKTVITTSIY